MPRVWLVWVCGIWLSCVAGDTDVSVGEEVAPERQTCRGVTPLPIEESRLAELTDENPIHCYSVALEAGDFLYVEVEQHGVDVELSLTDSDGEVSIDVDSPGGTHSTERLGFVAREAGPYQAVVRLSGALRGRRYSIRAEQPRAADETDVEYAKTCAAMSAGDALRTEGWRHSLILALRQYLRAQRTWFALGEISQEAIAWHRTALIWSSLGRVDLEEESFRRALAVLDRATDPEMQDVKAVRIDVLLRLGKHYREAARPQEAIMMNEEARRLAHEIGNRSNEMTALINLATVLFHNGKYEDARQYYLQAAKDSRELGYPTRLALCLRRLGDIYIILGDPEEAWRAYRESLTIGRDAADPHSIDTALLGFGWYYFFRGKYEDSLKSFDEVISDSRGRKDYDILAGALDRRGTVLFTLGRFDEALASYTEAIGVYESQGLVQPQGPILVNMGRVYLVSGKTEKALDVLDRALASVRQMKDKTAEAYALLLMARAQRELDQWEKAVANGTRALEIIESVRSDFRDPDDRLLFLEQPRQAFYEFNVDLMMDRAQSTKDQAFAARAFAIAERNRARVLFELLGEARREVHEEDPLDLPSVQRLLDPGTIMLVYFLGEDRSFLWRVGRDDFATYVLPKRTEIEATAVMLYGSLKRSSEVRMRGPLRLHTARLSQMVLQDVEKSLGGKRLVIVADGALQYIPFAALREPSSSEPLIVDHEIATLPSASVLSVLREDAGSSPNLWTVAVIADPVTERNDERLRGSRSTSENRGAGPREYPRLAFSQNEAKEILSLLPDERTFLAEGFDANLQAVLSGTFRGYDVVHFSAHGILDTERPERSAIVLSLFDRDGRPRAGLLQLERIRDLDLPVELVTLGACSTALGKEVRGEGLIGLTRGFMYAGASRVLVSLWDISDQATSELMKRFYRAISTGGEMPAAALRTAQRSMLEDPMFRSPYYWAPFVLQGDWR